MKTFKQKFVGKKWRLKSGLLYGGMRGVFCALVGPDEAQIFDSRDNPEIKSKFYGLILGVPFEVEDVA